MSGKIQSTIRQSESGTVSGAVSRFILGLELRAGHALAEDRLSGEGSIGSNEVAFETG